MNDGCLFCTPEQPCADHAAAASLTGTLEDVARLWEVFKPFQPTPILGTYFRFACERMRLHLKRLSGAPNPWTEVPVLRSVKFTVPYRALDRASQVLIREVLPGPDMTAPGVFQRILLYKLFNRPATWRAIVQAMGGPPRTGLPEADFKRLVEVMGAEAARGPVYASAYMMPPFGPQPHAPKWKRHLLTLREMMDAHLAESILKCPTKAGAYHVLGQVKGFGSFLSMQYLTDLCYSTAFSWLDESYVVAGPGAQSGIDKCFSNWRTYQPPPPPVGTSSRTLQYEGMIRLTHERFDDACKALGLVFPHTPGHPLDPMDTQNLFCEVNKLARVLHPEVRGIDDREQVRPFEQSTDPLPELTLPRKWGTQAQDVRAWVRFGGYRQ